MPDGTTIPFRTEAFGTGFDVLSGFGKDVQVDLDARSTVKRAFVTLAFSCVPIAAEAGDLSNNLSLSVEWLDEYGAAVDPSVLEQGTTFWGHFQAEKLGAADSRLDEVALAQVLPSGWEIENVRLSGEDLPSWMENWNLHQEEYVDIRDDRILWFFDLAPRAKQPLDFVVKLNAVTRGTFVLPPTLCEAMYDANFQARRAGGKVVVE
jgi:hypothetical protein